MKVKIGENRRLDPNWCCKGAHWGEKWSTCSKICFYLPQNMGYGQMNDDVQFHYGQYHTPKLNTEQVLGICVKYFLLFPQKPVTRED